jgi:hypothetical protein
MDVVEECLLDSPFRSLAQPAASQIQYLSNRKEIDQSFVRIVLENKELHKLFCVSKVSRRFRFISYRDTFGIYPMSSRIYFGIFLQ